MNLVHASLTKRIVGFAIEVHRELGPRLLESTYEECLCFELRKGSIRYKRQAPLPITYQGIRLDCSYRMDIVVEQTVLVEVKSVEQLQPIHEAQMLTYLRSSALKVGLLMNFNSIMLKQGLRRFVF
jgi:GxxExxY protein